MFRLSQDSYVQCRHYIGGWLNACHMMTVSNQLDHGSLAILFCTTFWVFYCLETFIHGLDSKNLSDHNSNMVLSLKQLRFILMELNFEDCRNGIKQDYNRD